MNVILSHKDGVTTLTDISGEDLTKKLLIHRASLTLDSANWRRPTLQIEIALHPKRDALTLDVLPLWQTKDPTTGEIKEVRRIVFADGSAIDFPAIKTKGGA